MDSSGGKALAQDMQYRCDAPRLHAVRGNGVDGERRQRPVRQDDAQAAISHGVCRFTVGQQCQPQACHTQTAHGGEAVAVEAAFDVEQMVFTVAAQFATRQFVINPGVCGKVGGVGDCRRVVQVGRRGVDMPAPVGEVTGDEVGRVQRVCAAAQGDVDAAVAQVGQRFVEVEGKAQRRVFAADGIKKARRSRRPAARYPADGRIAA